MVILIIGGLLWPFLDSGVEKEEVYNCWSPFSEVVYDIPTASINITITPTMLTACKVFTDSVSMHLNISKFNETIVASVSAFNYSMDQTITFACPQTDDAILQRCMEAFFTSEYASLCIQTVRYKANIDFTSISGNREHLTSCFSETQSLTTFDYTTGSGELKLVETGLCDNPAKPEVVSGTLAVRNAAGSFILTTSFDTKQPPTQPKDLTFPLKAISSDQLTTLFSAIKDPWVSVQLNYTIKVGTAKTTTVDIPLSMELANLYSSARASCARSILASIYGDRIRMLIEGASNPSTQDCQILANGQLTFNCHLSYTGTGLKATIEGISLFAFNFSDTQTIDFQCANGNLTCKSLLSTAFELPNLDSMILILEIMETGSNGDLSFYYKQLVTNKQLGCWQDAYIAFSSKSICVHFSSTTSDMCPISLEYSLLYALSLSLPDLGTFTQSNYFSLANYSVCWTCSDYTTMQVEGVLSCKSAMKSFVSAYKHIGRNKNIGSVRNFTEALFTATYAMSGIAVTVPVKRLVFLDTTIVYIIVFTIVAAFVLLATIHLGFGLRRIRIENLKLRRAKKLHAQKT
ncbi:Hypothetical protein GLP15_4591 [Giardia lamblia P15]|uniref:Uncharacterized protein n=1 Tax=Giardia intestinalis (strain P15) TaxID=658858 RepID=E1F126_GIAIA|nr:Hypothetical protein GLP15_4591 [Giardia lamblia P15]